MKTPAGETRTVNVAIAPLVTRKFQVIGRLVIMDDITERVELEGQLSQADKLSSIGLLAAGVAHEVNTPLAVISSYTQMLAKQLQGDPQKSGLLEKITRQTFRASEIVNNLLNFSRTSGTEFADVDVNKVIIDTLALLEHQFKTAKIQVRSELTPVNFCNSGQSRPAAAGIPEPVPQRQRRDARRRHAEHSHDQRRYGQRARLRYRIGHRTRTHAAHLRSVFHHQDTAPKEGQSRGTGLGLSVTYGIIQEHAGKIRVESHPGSGTTFALDFPLSRKAVHV